VIEQGRSARHERLCFGKKRSRAKGKNAKARRAGEFWGTVRKSDSKSKEKPVDDGESGAKHDRRAQSAAADAPTGAKAAGAVL
jgi:hypothetical protein